MKGYGVRSSLCNGSKDSHNGARLGRVFVLLLLFLGEQKVEHLIEMWNRVELGVAYGGGG